jgi:sec-independent protein translocase protein TatC
VVKGGEMSFWDHLEELRGSIIRSALYLCAFSCLGLCFKHLLFEGIILAPTRPDFCVYRLLGWDFGVKLINIDLSAQFFVHLRASLAAGLILSFPLIVWEIWKFVAPALYASEKKALRSAFLLSGVLFYVGVAVGYFLILPLCLQFFMNYTVSETVVNTISLNSYMGMFTSLVLLDGVVFEFPTVVLALSRLGILDKAMLRKGRRYAFVVILIFAAIITPADPVSMFVLAIPLYLLYEFSILLCSSRKHPALTK